MPQLIQHIDAIARSKQRDVLTIEFDFNNSSFKTHWLAHEARKTICDWLDANGIPFYPCGHFANETSIRRYQGQIYLDIPYDQTDTNFRKVQQFLENSDGSAKFEGVLFNYYSLESCMKNARHKESNY
jgi:hypothetical protein